MTEPQTLDSKIEAELGQIASIEGIRRSLNLAENKEQEDVLTDRAFGYFSSLVPEDAENRQQFVQTIDRELHINPYRRVKKELAARVVGNKEDYDSNFDLIYAKIEEKLEAELAEVDSIDKGIATLLPYVLNAVEIPKRSREEIYREITQGLSAVFRTPLIGNYSEFVDPEKEQSDRYVKQTSDLIKEEKDKDDKVTGYSIDSKKLKELIKENIVAGSILYTAEKQKKKD